MARIIKGVLLAVLAVCSPWVAAQQEVLSGDAAKVRIAIGWSLEPYVLSTGEGILATTIVESFRSAGASVEFIQTSNSEALALYNAGEADGVAVVKLGMVEGYYTPTLVVLQNYAITLSKRDITISELGDLKNYRVMAFSYARKYLGQEFSDAVDEAVKYVEAPKQERQVRDLYDGKTDVVIADRKVFEFHWKRLRNRPPLDPKWRMPVSFTYAFPPNEYRAAFHSEQHQQLFEKGFTQLKESGRLQEIEETYTDLLERY